MFGYMLSMVLMAGIGAAMLLKPHFFWEISHFFTTEGGKPTDLYLTFVRISGSILIGLAVGTLAVLLLY